MEWWKCFYKVLVGQLFLASEIFQLSLSAVDSGRNPCEPGEFYKDFLGICLSCRTYCVGKGHCRSACTTETSMSTIRPPTHPQITTVSPVTHPTSVATSALGDFLSNNPTELTSGGGNVFSSKPSYLELSAELVFGVFCSLLLLVIMFICFSKYRKTLKMPNVCCFFTGESTHNADPEGERSLSPPLEAPPTENEPSSRHPNSNGYALVQVNEDSMGARGNAGRNRPGPPGLRSPPRLDARTTGPCISANPLCGFRSKSHVVGADGPTEYKPYPMRSYANGYVPVQVNDDPMEMRARGTADRNRPGPPGLRSPLPLDARRTGPGIPANPPSGFRSASGFVDAEAPFRQSARMQLSEPLEREILQGAIPTDQRFKREKTPEIYRKVTDGSHEHHEYTTGASLFIPPASMHEDIPMNRYSGHGK